MQPTRQAKPKMGVVMVSEGSHRLSRLTDWVVLIATALERRNDQECFGQTAHCSLAILSAARSLRVNPMPSRAMEIDSIMLNPALVGGKPCSRGLSCRS
jgi:hypothetical protein